MVFSPIALNKSTSCARSAISLLNSRWYLDHMTNANAKVSIKSLNFIDTRYNLWVQLAMSSILQTKRPKLLENPEKNKLWGRRRAKIVFRKLERTFGPKRRDSDSSTDIDRPQQTTASWTLNGVRSLLGLRPTPGHRVHTLVGDMWRALTRRRMKNFGRWCAERDGENARSVSNGIFVFFVCFKCGRRA